MEEAIRASPEGQQRAHKQRESENETIASGFHRGGREEEDASGGCSRREEE